MIAKSYLLQMESQVWTHLYVRARQPDKGFCPKRSPFPAASPLLMMIILPTPWQVNEVKVLQKTTKLGVDKRAGMW